MKEEEFKTYLQDIYPLTIKNCIKCISSVKGICKILKRVPEHRCDKYEVKKD